jgi:hypothetical protein
MERRSGEGAAVDLRFLAQSVYDGTAHDEGYLLEVKTVLGFKDAEHRGKIARAVLGFANRLDQDPRPSALFLGLDKGCVEADRCEVDPSDARKALQPLLGTPGPRWQFANVNVNGCVVHAIVVDPPRWGDPIFALNKEFTVAAGKEKPKTYQRGTIFVREGSDSNLASPEAIKMLTERAIASDRFFRDVAVAVQSGAAFSVPSDGIIPELIAEERARMLHFLDEPYMPTGRFAKLAREDTRTAEEYTAAVEDYLEILARQLVKWIRWLPNRLNPATFTVANLGVDNRAEVRLEISLPDGCSIVVDPDEAKSVERPMLPRKPARFGWSMGSSKPYEAAATLQRLILVDDPYRETRRMLIGPLGYSRTPYLVGDNDRTVRYPTFDLRANHTVSMEPIIVAVTKPTSSIDVDWSLTATNCSGNPRGTTTLPVSTGVTLDDLRDIIRKRT